MDPVDILPVKTGSLGVSSESRGREADLNESKLEQLARSRLEGVGTPRLQSIGLVWDLLALPTHAVLGSGPLSYRCLISHGSWGGGYDWQLRAGDLDTDIQVDLFASSGLSFSSVSAL